MVVGEPEIELFDDCCRVLTVDLDDRRSGSIAVQVSWKQLISIVEKKGKRKASESLQLTKVVEFGNLYAILGDGNKVQG